MKVISGSLKGRVIKGYDILGTRPTMDRVKESLFAMIQDRIKESVCLDLFAGSGNLGIEAISNGACLVYFVDNNKKAINVIKDNLINFNILDKSKILNIDYKDALRHFSSTNTSFDLIFIDPPYNMKVIEEILEFISLNKLLNKDGQVICECDDFSLKEKYNNLVMVKQKKYANKMVYIYC